MANAARLGLKVAKPHGETSRYDVLVEGEGKLHRVQVKSTLLKRGTYYPCMCSWIAYQSQSSAKGANHPKSLSGQRHRKIYSKDQADFIAAYVIPEDVWFIIPVSKIDTSTLYLPSRENVATNRHGHYLEAWHLLGAGESGKLTIHAAAESDLLLALIKRKLAEACGIPRT